MLLMIVRRPVCARRHQLGRPEPSDPRNLHVEPERTPHDG